MLSVSFKEIILVVAIIGALIWMRAFRTSMETQTERFFLKLKGPDYGPGFGWRGMLAAFVLGIVCCTLLAVVSYRLWSWYAGV